MYRDNLIALIHKVYREDHFVQKLFNSYGLSLDEIDERMNQFISDLYFDSCSSEMLKKYENQAGIKTVGKQSLEDRRSALMAKWRSGGKNSISLLQDIANSWKNGKTDITFTEGIIRVSFTDEFGVPEGLDSLKVALEDVKPAHLPITYILKYLLVSNVSGMTIAELQENSIINFAFNERG